MNNQLLIKEKLQAKLEKIQVKSDGSPVTDLKLDKTLTEEIEKLTTELESVNPNLNPLLNATFLLEGAWATAILYCERNPFFSFSPIGIKTG